MIRIAAVGDVHYGTASRNLLRSSFASVDGRADLFLVAGDLTQAGTVGEAQALVEDLSVITVPVVAILGNHDYHSDHDADIRRVLSDSGVTVLEGESAVFDVRGQSVGVAGMKGFGGGFAGACITEFGEPETKAFAHHSRVQAEILRRCLEELKTDYKFALLHFSPIEGTLLGERREIYPFLGCYLLAEAIDAVGADAAFHGHAHHGIERGETPDGVPVRNVAVTVIRHAFNIYSFEAPRTRS